MHELYELKEKLLKELLDYNQNSKFSKEDAELIKYLSSAIDHMCNIAMDMEEEGMSERGSSREGGSYRGGSYRGGSSRRGGGSREGSSRRGSSYEGGGSSYAQRRNRMGQFSREGEDDFRMMLEEAMENAPNDQLRMQIERMMQQM